MINWVLAAALLVAAACAAGADSQFSFREASPTALELVEDGKPVYVYNFGPTLAPGFPQPMARSCYLHPVYAPDGTVITDDFNKDHPHHRGISWMWQDVTVDGKTGDIWTVGRFRQRFVRWTRRETNPDSAVLAVENGWFDGDRKFLKEDVEIVAHKLEGSKRLLDFTLRFEPVDKPVRIVGTSEENKGYGGFCFRFAPRDGGSARTSIRTEEGIAMADGVMSRHSWAEVSGLFGGKPESGRVEDDRSNPGFPHNGWLMRHGFGFLNVSYPGREPLVIEEGKPLVLKYRVILTSGE